MKIIEIEQKILQTKVPTDFVALCTTNWHLTGVFAYLTKLHETEGRSLYGFIVIKEHEKSGYLLDPATINCPSYVNAEFCFLDENDSRFDLRNLLRRHKSNGYRKLYIISANSPWLPMACQCANNKGSLISLVVVDEGLSCYFGRWHWIRQKLYEKKGIYKAVVLAGKYITIDILKLVLGFKEEKFTLLNIKQGSCIPNFCTVKYYKKVVIGDIQDLSVNFNDTSDYAIFLTQPLVEDGLIGREKLFEFYCRIASNFKEAGIELYFKTHPREKNLDFYHNNNLNLIEDKRSAEELIFSLKNEPVFILGLYTTSLVSIKLFYNIETISLNKLIVDNTLPEEINGILHEFNRRFKNIISIPEREEFETILNNKKYNT